MKPQLKQNLIKLFNDGKKENNGFYSSYYESTVSPTKFFQQTIELVAELSLNDFKKQQNKLNVWYEQYVEPDNTHYLLKNLQLASLCNSACIDFVEKINFLMANQQKEKFYFIELLSITPNIYPNIQECFSDFFASEIQKRKKLPENERNKFLRSDESHDFRYNILEKVCVNNFAHFKQILEFFEENNLVHLHEGKRGIFIKRLFENNQINEELVSKLQYLVEHLNINLNMHYSLGGYLATTMLKNSPKLIQDHHYQATLDYILPLLNDKVFQEVTEHIKMDHADNYKVVQELRIMREKAKIKLNLTENKSKSIKIL